MRYVSIAQAAEAANVHHSTLRRKRATAPAWAFRQDGGARGPVFVALDWLAQEYPHADGLGDDDAQNLQAEPAAQPVTHSVAQVAQPVTHVRNAQRTDVAQALRTLRRTVKTLSGQLDAATVERARLVALLESERERGALQVNRLQDALQSAHGELQDVSRRLAEAQDAHARALQERNAAPVVQVETEPVGGQVNGRAVVWAVWLAAGAVVVIAVAVVVAAVAGQV